MQTAYIFLLGLSFLFNNHNSSSREFSYQKTDFQIGESYRSVQKKFKNNLSCHCVIGKSDADEIIRYFDIKEKTLVKGKVRITPSIYFGFSRPDSLLERVVFDFLSDNNVEAKDEAEILRFLSKQFPVLKEYRKTRKESYTINGKHIVVKADLREMQIIVTLQ